MPYALAQSGGSCRFKSFRGNVPLNRQNLILPGRYSLYGEEILVSRLIHVSGVDFVSRMICIQIEVKMNSRKDKQILGFYPFRRLGKDHGRSHSGFTLVEVMVTVAIIGILVALGTTSLSTLLPKMRLRSAARDVLANIEETKMAAIERGNECTIDFSALTSYTICQENDSTAGCNATTDIIIKTVDLASRYDNHITLHAPSFSSHKYVNFDKLGLPDGTFGHVFCKNNNNSTKKIVVGFNGNVKIE